MSSQIATVAFVIGILALFALDRDPKARTSFALLIPMVWLLIGGSRVVSQWLDPTAQTSASAYASAYMEGNPIDRAVQTVLMALGMIVLARRGQRLWQLLRANGPILLFLLYCGASTLWSDYPDVALRRWIKALGGPACAHGSTDLGSPERLDGGTPRRASPGRGIVRNGRRRPRRARSSRTGARG